eukprot:3140860-Alexandrium_andersonii.AAC.1
MLYRPVYVCGFRCVCAPRVEHNAPLLLACLGGCVGRASTDVHLKVYSNGHSRQSRSHDPIVRYGALPRHQAWPAARVV